MQTIFDNLTEALTGEPVAMVVSDLNPDEPCSGPFPMSQNQITARASAFGRRCKMIKERRIADGTWGTNN